jgi:hypothetical protein
MASIRLLVDCRVNIIHIFVSVNNYRLSFNEKNDDDGCNDSGGNGGKC